MKFYSIIDINSPTMLTRGALSAGVPATNVVQPSLLSRVGTYLYMNKMPTLAGYKGFLEHSHKG